MLSRRNLLRRGRDKGLRRSDPRDPFRETGPTSHANSAGREIDSGEGIRVYQKCVVASSILYLWALRVEEGKGQGSGESAAP